MYLKTYVPYLRVYLVYLNSSPVECSSMSACALPHGFQPKHILYCAPSPPPQEQRDRSVVAVVLGDNLHYPQCVVKLEILLLCFQETLISHTVVGNIWTRPERRDDVIVAKSVCRMLTRMALDLSTDEREELFKVLLQVKRRMRVLVTCMYKAHARFNYEGVTGTDRGLLLISHLAVCYRALAS